MTIDTIVNRRTSVIRYVALRDVQLMWQLCTTRVVKGVENDVGTYIADVVGLVEEIVLDREPYLEILLSQSIILREIRCFLRRSSELALSHNNDLTAKECKH